MNATQVFGVEELGRVTIDGRRWVAYGDGAFRHVVEASHYDDASAADDYTVWCRKNRTAWADDATAAKVAAAIGLTHVHSATDGVCGRVPAAESEYRIAYLREDGSWDIVQAFLAAGDNEANAYAEENCHNDDWYVLDAAGRNINGGIDG